MLARMGMPDGRHRELLEQALAIEGRAHRALLDGDADAAALSLRAASALYRASWEAAPPGSYGRLIGMLKAAVIAGDAVAEATYARGQLDAGAESPPARYAAAITALVLGEDDVAAAAAEGMRAGSPAFGRAADAVAALAGHDGEAYERALRAIVEDFESRDAHLTGVAIADTALMLERLAEARGVAAHPASPLLPAPG
jgi:hypothetical protein